MKPKDGKSKIKTADDGQVEKNDFPLKKRNQEVNFKVVEPSAPASNLASSTLGGG